MEESCGCKFRVATLHQITITQPLTVPLVIYKFLNNKTTPLDVVPPQKKIYMVSSSRATLILFMLFYADSILCLDPTTNAPHNNQTRQDWQRNVRNPTFFSGCRMFCVGLEHDMMAILSTVALQRVDIGSLDSCRHPVDSYQLRPLTLKGCELLSDQAGLLSGHL